MLREMVTVKNLMKGLNYVEFNAKYNGEINNI